MKQLIICKSFFIFVNTSFALLRMFFKIASFNFRDMSNPVSSCLLLPLVLYRGGAVSKASPLASPPTMRGNKMKDRTWKTSALLSSLVTGRDSVIKDLPSLSPQATREVESSKTSLPHSPLPVMARLLPYSPYLSIVPSVRLLSYSLHIVKSIVGLMNISVSKKPK